MHRFWGVILLTSLLISCGRDFGLPEGELAIIDLTVAPDRVASGVELEIAFGLQGELDGLPRVNLLGQSLPVPEPVAGRYGVAYLADGSEPEGVDVVVEVSATSGSDRASEFRVARFDFTPPSVIDVAVSSTRISAGETLTLDLILDEPLASIPAVTLIDPTAAAPVMNCLLTGQLLRCTHQADGSETEGWIRVSSRLTDLAGNEASLALPVGAAFDASAPPVIRLGQLTPSEATRGMTVRIPFSVNQPLQALPTVTVAGGAASRLEGPDAEGHWVYAYFVTGNELGAQPTSGPAPVRIEVTGQGGLGSFLVGSLPLDFKGPALVGPVTASLPVISAGESVEVTLTFDEPTAAVAALIQGTPFTCTAQDARTFTCSYTASGLEQEGPVALAVIAADLLGNSTTLSTPGGFVLDFACELDREKTFLARNHLGERRFLAEPGAFEAGALVTLMEQPTSAPLLSTPAGTDGSVAALLVPGLLADRVFVTATDPQGHTCAVERSRSRFVADFSGSPTANPDLARLLTLGTPRPHPDALQPEATLVDHGAIVAADGQAAELDLNASPTVGWVGPTPWAGVPYSPSVSPLAWSPQAREVMLWSRDGSSSSYVWGWDGSNWTLHPQVSGTAPYMRRSYALTYDSIHGELQIFGGASTFGDATEDRLALFDGYGFTLAPSWPRPRPRMVPSLAFDLGRGETLLFGGSNPGWFPESVFSDELWAWDGQRWQERPTSTRPPARNQATFTYDPIRDQVVLFGGGDSGGWLDDTWTWTGSAWVQHQPAISPLPRTGHAATFHDGLGGVVVHAGDGEDYAPLNDLWLWNGVRWQELSLPGPVPPALSSHGLAYDPIRGCLVLFGGLDVNSDPYWDLWELPSDAYFPVLFAEFSMPSLLELSATATLELTAEGSGTHRDGTTNDEVDLSLWDPALHRWVLVERLIGTTQVTFALSSGQLQRFNDGRLRVLVVPAVPSSPAGGARLAIDHLVLEIDDG